MLDILQDCNIRDSLQYEKPIQFVFPLNQSQAQTQQNNYVPELPKVIDVLLLLLLKTVYRRDE